MRLILLLFILCTLQLTSCREERYQLIEPELKVYVDRFFAEAELRNANLLDNNLEVVFEDLSSEGLCGRGFFSFEQKNIRRVEISRDLFCWDIRTDYGREGLVFHELGHAILKEIHRNRRLANGLPANMMCGGNVCDVFDYYDHFTLGKRAYYLDELFNAATPDPAWGRIKSKATSIFVDAMEDKSIRGQLELTDSTFSNNFTHKITTLPNATSKNLQIRANDILDNPVSANWVYRIDQPTVQEGDALQMSATISTENMQGEGIVLAIRTISGNAQFTEVSAAVSSRNSLDITGNSPTQKYEVILPYCPSHVQLIELIFRITSNTSGIVNLDDVNLSILE